MSCQIIIYCGGILQFYLFLHYTTDVAMLVPHRYCCSVAMNTLQLWCRMQHATVVAVLWRQYATVLAVAELGTFVLVFMLPRNCPENEPTSKLFWPKLKWQLKELLQLHCFINVAQWPVNCQKQLGWRGSHLM